MASQYQHRQFFRRVPNALLARYFEARGVNLDLDFESLTETQVDPISEAFTTLPEEQQADMEVIFRTSTPWQQMAVSRYCATRRRSTRT